MWRGIQVGTKVTLNKNVIDIVKEIEAILIRDKAIAEECIRLISEVGIAVTDIEDIELSIYSIITGYDSLLAECAKLVSENDIDMAIEIKGRLVKKCDELKKELDECIKEVKHAIAENNDEEENTLYEENKRLKEDIAIYKKSREEDNNYIELLKRSYTGFIDSLKDNVESYKARHKELEAEIRDLKTIHEFEVASSNVKISTLKSAIADLEYTVDGLNNTVEDLNEEVDSLNAELDGYHDIEELNAELDGYDDSLECFTDIEDNM